MEKEAKKLELQVLEGQLLEQDLSELRGGRGGVSDKERPIGGLEDQTTSNGTSNCCNSGW